MYLDLFYFNKNCSLIINHITEDVYNMNLYLILNSIQY